MCVLGCFLKDNVFFCDVLKKERLFFLCICVCFGACVCFWACVCFYVCLEEKKKLFIGVFGKEKVCLSVCLE